MEYTKPEVSCIDRASVLIEGAVMKVQGGFDSETTHSAPAAYEADE